MFPIWVCQETTKLFFPDIITKFGVFFFAEKVPRHDIWEAQEDRK